MARDAAKVRIGVHDVFSRRGLDKGTIIKSPDSTEAQNLVKMLQNHITENYYLCTNEILASLGQMYVADERFTNNIDKHADGTATFICEAIAAYCSK